MLRKMLASILFFFLAISWTFAQTGSVTGVITDVNTGEPLPGANMYIADLERGASADMNGNYTISNIPAGTYLVRISYIGYQFLEQEVEVESGENVYDFQLQSSFIGMDEVVVTALGIERERRAVGYAVQEIDGQAVANSQESNLVNALAAKVAGVQINSSSGQPGASSRITIRGNSSMLGNNQPLFVVDGIPISNDSDDNPQGEPLLTGGTSNRALDIDPSIIQDVSVLKGASATALYGSRAANGAVIITTKSGVQDQAPRITFNSSVRWDDAVIDGFNDEYLGGFDGLYANGLPPGEGGYAEPGYSTTGNTYTIMSWGPHKDEVSEQVLDDLGVDQIPVYDPREEYYETALSVDNSINLSGGTDLSTYFFSVNNIDQTGIVPGTELKRTSLMGKFGSTLSDYLNVQTSVQYSNTANDWLSEGNGEQNFLYALNFTPISYNILPYQYQDGTQRMHHQTLNNPFWLSENNPFSSNVDRFISSSQITIDILPWLSVSERIGIDTYTDTRKGRANVGTRSYTSGMFDQKITRTQINSDLTVSARRDFTDELSMDLMVGNNINSRNYHYDLIQGTNLTIPDFFHVSNASVVTADEEKELIRLYSFYGQATLDYSDYLYLTLTARNDWSSTLPDGNNSYFYPSASVGFVFTDAFDIFNPSSVFSFGKIRASVSQIGNDAPPYSLFPGWTQAGPSDGVRGDINYPFQGVNGYQLDISLGNSELKPEISTEYEVGADLRFLESRARLDFALYNRTTKNQIFAVPVSPASGFESRLSNAGEIKNSGIEATLGLTPVQSRDFQFDLEVNFAKNTTEVVELAPGVENIFLGGFNSPQIRIEPAKNGYGVIWGNRYEHYESGPDAGTLVIDEDGYPIQAGSDGPIGNVQPDWTGNLRTTFHFKGFRLSALLDKRQGGDILNMDLYYTAYYGTAEITEKRGTSYIYDGVVGELNSENEWISTGEQNTTEIVRDQAYYQNFYSSTFSNFVEDGSFLKLRELSLAYTIPHSVISRTPFQALTIKGIGRNLWMQTDFSYGDPEGSLYGSENAQGFYHMVTPSTRSYSLSLQVTF